MKISAPTLIKHT